MTEDVAALVLRNNYQQTLALSLAEQRGLEDLGFQRRLMHILETRGELDRAVEYLPDEIELAARRRQSQGLTRPELAVLLAYAKLSLNHELLQSSVPDDPYLGRELGRYFPQALAEKFPDAIAQHRLRREIVATQLTNSMINRSGAAAVMRIAGQTSASAASIAAAFAAVRGNYDMIALNTRSTRSTTRSWQAAANYQSVQDLLDRLVWFLRNVDLTQGLDTIVRHYARASPPSAALDTALPEAAAGAAQCARTADQGRRPRRAGAPRDVAGSPPRRHRHGRRPHRRTWPRLPPPTSPPRRSRLDHPNAAAASSSRIITTAALDRALGRWRCRAPPTAAMAGNGATAGAHAVRPGWPRARPRSTASACRCTRSPTPASRCRSCRWRRACWAISSNNDRSRVGWPSGLRPVFDRLWRRSCAACPPPASHHVALPMVGTAR
jgi:hypothetical protein